MLEIARKNLSCESTSSWERTIFKKWFNLFHEEIFTDSVQMRAVGL